MNTATATARRAAAAASAAILLLLLGLAWEIRPPLPALPDSLSASITHDEIGAALALLAWGLFVLLDLILLARVIELGTRRIPTTAEQRVRQAFATAHEAAPGPPNWRRLAAPLAPPVMRLTARAPIAAETADRPGNEHRLPAEPSLAIAQAEADDALLASESRLQIRLLGPLELAGDGVKQTGRKATKELLAYLALHPHGATRDEIFAVLWPDESLKQSEQRFWRATIDLRRVLPNALRRAGERYLLDRNEVAIDLDQLAQLQRRAANENDSRRRRELLEHMLTLFRGDPFTGIESEWAEAEARHFRAVAVDAHERLGRLRLDGGDAVGALAAAEKGIALDALNEPLWRLALEAEAALGLRQSVVERYETLRRLLDERLGLEPQRETRALSRQLLGQE